MHKSLKTLSCPAAVSVPVWAHAHAYNSGLVWALPIKLMWPQSVIFVPMLTRLYPMPVLWCGVSCETVKKVTFFSSFCTKRFVTGQLSTRWCVAHKTNLAGTVIQRCVGRVFTVFRYLCTIRSYGQKFEHFELFGSSSNSQLFSLFCV